MLPKHLHMIRSLVSWIQWGVNAKSSLKICSITKMATFLLACLSTHCSKYFPKSANKIRNVIISFYQGIFIFHGFFWTKINTSLWDEGQKLNVFVRRISTLIFYVVFNAEFDSSIRILCFRCAIIDLLWPSRAQLSHSRSIMVQRKHKILMVPLNLALKTTYIEKSGF